MPYGEEWNEPPSNDTRRFTGKERDSETNLYYFGARYYGAGVGIFTVVDPAMSLESNLADPRRWNRYAYVLGNPLRYIDPTGENAVVNCEGSSCNVTVRAQIVASPGSADQMSAAMLFKLGAEIFWTQQRVTAPSGESLNFDVQLDIVEPGTENPAGDLFYVVTGSGRAYVNQTLRRGSSAASPPDTGVIFTQDSTNNPGGLAALGAHETGHLMGLPDLSTGRVGYDPSYDRDIMRNAQVTNNASSSWFVLSQFNGNSVISRQP